MNKYIAVMIIACVVILSGCSKNVDIAADHLPGQTAETIDIDEETETNGEFDSKEEDMVPEELLDIYDSFLRVNKEAGDSVRITKFWHEKFPYSDGIKFYAGQSMVVLDLKKDGHSYNVLLSRRDSNADLKTIVQMTVAAFKGIEFTEAEQYMHALLDSYTGKQNGKPVYGNKYRFIILDPDDPAMSEGWFGTLSVYKMADYQHINRSDYPEADSQFMQAAINIGENASLSGEVTRIEEEPGWITLSVRNKDNKYIVKCSPAAFSGDFAEGESYVFYGKVMQNTDDQDGILRLVNYNRI